MNLGEDMSKGRDSRRAMLDERKRDKPGPASQENQRPCILESSIWTTTAVHMNAWMLDTIFKYAWSHVYTLRFPRTRKLCGGILPSTGIPLQAISFIMPEIVVVQYYMRFKSWLALTRMHPINKANSILGDKLS